MSEQPEFLIEAEDLGDGATLVRTIVNEIRHPGTASQIGDEMRSLIVQGCKRLVLDLSHTRYMSSSGFAALLNVARKLSEQGGKMTIGRIHPDVLVGSKIIGLDQIIPIHPDLRSAEAAVRDKSPSS
jgi:anti-anti-sigma factor